MAQQIIIEVENTNIVGSLRKILSQIKGVSVVSGNKTRKAATKQSAYEQSLGDVQQGRLYSYDSPEELFNKMGI